MKINQLRQYISDQINGHSSCRIDCPVCNGSNTFSISKIDGNIVYYCFRASCGIRGKIDDVLSIDDLRNISSTSFVRGSLLSRPLECLSAEVYDIPGHFISPLQNTRSFNVLKRYNLIDFYTKHPETIRYDPKLDRLVFILKDKGKVKGATGRSLSFGVKPRWFVYDRIMGCPFIVYEDSKSKTVILVEDCISACVLFPFVNSIALLGTSIPDELISYLSPYSRLYIALDADATAKAIKLQKQLSSYKETHIIQLRKDIKYFSTDELDTLKKEII